VPWLQLQGVDTMGESGRQLTNLLSGQLTSYNFVTLHSPGDQPGRGTARYLSQWKHLPDGVYISKDKLTPLPVSDWKQRRDKGETNLPMVQLKVPFPLTTSTNRIAMPCIAFNFRGGLLGPDTTEPRRIDELVTLTRGSVIYARDGNGKLQLAAPDTIETPKTNSVYNPYIRIDWITGRPRIEEPVL